MSREVHITSLLIHVRPSGLEPLVAALQGLQGVEIHARDPAGKLVLVLETAHERHIVETIDFIEQQQGVLAVSMSYHHVERADLLAQES
jgi:nitrate reductase NapD